MQKCMSFFLILTAFALSGGAREAESSRADLEAQFSGKVQPFLETYCVNCHGSDEPEAEMDLSAYPSMTALLQDGQRWGLLLERLKTEEMPPTKAKRHPSVTERSAIVDWFRAVREYEIQRNAGDPGLVLARRLSHAEYNYSVRDLTGVDLRPTREFPVDPANTAGFDNSGETLVMSPTILNKYLQAAREVASHLFLREQGFAFAPHPMLSEADREKFCVQQIIDFYHRQDLDYADYFQAAWRFRHRAVLGRPGLTLADGARENGFSPKYLATIWSTLEEAKEDVGPLARLQAMWRVLPAPRKTEPDLARTGCEAMREYVVAVRQKVERRFLNITAGEAGTAWLPFLAWKNIQYATHRRSFDPAQLQVAGEPATKPDPLADLEWDNQFGPGKTILLENAPGDPDLVVPAGERARYEAAFAKFARVFPDMFYKEQRGRNYFKIGRDAGRYLSAGYHNVMGYFRDDQPFYELLLDEPQQAQLDGMWRELDFVASANLRSYVQFAVNGTRGARESFPDHEPAITLVAQLNDREIASPPIIKQLEAGYLARVTNGDEVAINAIKDYFRSTDDGIRWVERARRAAEPGQLEALLDFAARAYRHPLSAEERTDVLEFYHTARSRDGLDHEAALRETSVVVLMSPEFTYRFDLVQPTSGLQPLSNYDLASRLSYFLWSSLPDRELLARATAGDLHDPKVIAAQARRMVRDPRARALAIEFGGNWLDFRRFEDIGTVDRNRFPAFTGELRQAMFEEPIRFLLDVFQTNRPILDFLYADDTMVNGPLALHYGIPLSGGSAEQWVDVRDANRYGRGGLLPMAVFLTKNAPGLRTSPVKRGNWLVKNILGERIPPPPPNVPELPKDEARTNLSLREMLEQHRADKNCAACHARFDSLGLVFEAFGPIGERRSKDLAGRAIDARAIFPGGSEGEGLQGVRQYIREHREGDFVDNFCGKLVAYALGRSLMLSDEPLIRDMRRRLAAGGYRFESVIESIVTSRQFLHKRGREQLAANEK
ncbi:MAG: DUF1592 domain-containing protein [Opitutus sp.]|nr:DUF1592 domain-containing protein [Opitutus sp.]